MKSRTAHNWFRVTRSNPCPICGKPDWCLLANDGNATICARKDSARRAGEGGWLHLLRDPLPPPPVRVVHPSAPPRDWQAFVATSERDGSTGLPELASNLGVTTNALRRLRVGWSREHKAWSFPLTDHRGQIRGVRLRLRSGRKMAVRGGRDGLFMPYDMPDSLKGLRLCVCEGASDSAVLLDLGQNAIGRPSCSGGVSIITWLVRARLPGEVVIIGDSDHAGYRGAEALGSVLRLYCRAVRILFPPQGLKDARDWYRAGLTPEAFELAVDATKKLT